MTIATRHLDLEDVVGGRYAMRKTSDGYRGRGWNYETLYETLLGTGWVGGRGMG